MAGGVMAPVAMAGGAMAAELAGSLVAVPTAVDLAGSPAAVSTAANPAGDLFRLPSAAAKVSSVTSRPLGPQRLDNCPRYP